MHSSHADVVISIPYAMSARNILRSDIFRSIAEVRSTAIFSPLAADPLFRKEFESDRVQVFDLPRNRTRRFLAVRFVLDLLEAYYFSSRKGSETTRILGKVLRTERPFDYYARTAIGRVGAHMPVIRSMRRLQARWGVLKIFGQQFEQLSPRVLFCTHPLAMEEVPLMVEAVKRGVKVIAMIHSWDNLTAKSGLRTVVSSRPGRMLPIEFDRVIVWNDIQAAELQRYYGYERSQIFIAGVPQFDTYVKSDFRCREAIIQDLGGDPSKKLILYAVGSSKLLPQQMDVISALVSAIKEKRFRKPSQLVIRGHPGSESSEWNRFRAVPGVILQSPSTADTPLSRSRGWQLNDGSERALAEALKASDVVVNVASTIALDAAMLDKPTICIAFDGVKPRTYLQSIRKHYDFTHYLPVVESKGVKLATSADELVKQINQYLEDPQLDAEGRQRIVTWLCHNRDGMAGKRVGEFLLKEAEAVCSMRSGKQPPAWQCRWDASRFE